MALSYEQIKEILKSPEKRQTISKAVKQEDRVRFHVENYTDNSEISQPLNTFLSWVKTLIPKDKYNIFLSLFKLPVLTTQLTETVYRELERVFDGRNPVNNYQFTDSEYLADWSDYRKNNLNEPIVWRKKGWDAVKTSINSVLVVDVPREQTGTYPEPYFYFLDIGCVIDYKLKDVSLLDYIVFKQKNNKVAVIDDTFYRMFAEDERGKLGALEVENEHGLGYCPARLFWSTELNQAQPDIKKSPLASQLSNLDWALFFAISKRHLDLYAPYPIYSAYEADCDFENNETGSYCDGGFLRDSNHNYQMYSGAGLVPCPVCSEKRITGAGSFIEVPVPAAGETDLKDPVSITTIDKDSLTYNVEEVERLNMNIFSSVVGLGGDVTQKQSLNEMQVSANFESKTSVLNSLKANLEAAQKFVDDTVCKLRYGTNFISSSISLGTEFYIYSVNDLYAQYKQAKENGASESELDAINESILATEYRNNPGALQRMQILKQIEPYRHLTQAELITLSDKGLLDQDQLKIKINFPSLIDRFERENTNIIEFGSQLEFDKKINIVNQTLLDYVRN